MKEKMNHTKLLIVIRNGAQESWGNIRAVIFN